MPALQTQEVTAMLHRLHQGAEEEFPRLFQAVYYHLRRLAVQQLRHERQGHTLNPTALVHEAFLRLVDQSEAGWNDRKHFFRAAAQAMRRILISYARRRNAARRGGQQQHLPLHAAPIPEDRFSFDLLALDTALQKLATWDERQARLVELHVFGGLTLNETSEVLEISIATAKREWASARTWLYREIFWG
ncbi:sigma-70 family RNA polymerase sigma factor [candidate division KSB1 bacterium]|nr:sigma-70 family RNA polymerase sigma factor [candidate division KSB1 bacterium]